MQQRRSIRFPVTLGVVLIVLILLLTTGWILLSTFLAIGEKTPAIFWALLVVGAVCFACVLAGVIIYLVLSIQAINLAKRQSNFIDAVTHELKTPIASLTLLLQTLTTKTVTEEERSEFYRLMLGDANRLDSMINQVLAAARLDHDAGSRDGSVHRLDHLIAQVIKNRSDMFHTNHKVSENLEACHTAVPSGELQIAVDNLVSNAIKYGGEPAEVWVELRPDAGKRFAILKVRDNGVGIEKRDWGRIFHRFVRLENELERRQKGTGLGLHLVRTIVKRNKGSVRVLKSEIGKGSVFEMKIPMVSQVPAQGNGQSEGS